MEEVLINSVSEHLKYTQIISNLSRQKMLMMTICSMLKTRKVVGLVAVAVTFCNALGVYIDEKEKKFHLKKHKRKTKSFFRCGLDFMQDIFKTDYKYKQETIRIFRDFIQFIFTNNDFSLP